jgi:hypothetical protein
MNQSITHSTVRRDIHKENLNFNRNNNNQPRYNHNFSPAPNIQNSPRNYIPRSPDYYNKQCNYCKMQGHLEKDCRKKKYCESQQQGNEAGPSGRQDNPKKDQSEKICPIKVNLEQERKQG